MADVKISALPAATTPLTGGEVLPVVQSGVTTKVAVSNLTAGLAGTASININGTVGATTPTTGAFTSGTFSTTLGVTGTSTLAAVNASGNITIGGAAAVSPILRIEGENASNKSILFYSNGVFKGSMRSSATAGFATVFEVAGAGGDALSIAQSGAVTIPGTLGVTGTITPGQTTGIVGTTTNNNAQTGSVGEYISSTVNDVSAVSMSNGTTVNVTSISLTAGDWDVSGSVAFSQPGTTNVTNLVVAVNSSSATLPNGDERSVAYIAAAGIVFQQEPSLKIIPTRYSLSGTTTIYLVAYTNFSISTLKAYGRISARRVR